MPPFFNAKVELPLAVFVLSCFVVAGWLLGGM
jgi:hypothetical protein